MCAPRQALAQRKEATVRSVKQLNQFGDTIVEVLIVTAVLGLVLAGSYAIASRSLKGMRASQERGEALKLAEAQIESIKTAVAAKTPGVVQHSQNLFCLKLPAATPAEAAPHKFSLPAKVTQPIENDDFGRYPEACKSGIYHIAVEPTLVAGRGNYAVYVRWDGIGSIGRQEVVLRYRLAPQEDD